MWKSRQERKEEMRGRKPASAVPTEEEENERDTAKEEEEELQMLDFQKEVQN